jgi:dihydroorotase
MDSCNRKKAARGTLLIGRLLLSKCFSFSSKPFGRRAPHSRMPTATLPLLIDCHVHFREPGLEHKADMATEAEAAYYGGIRTVCEMPNTKPGTNTVEALADKVRRAARAKDKCDIRFFFGATAAEHVAELERLWTDESLRELRSRCSGLKLYLDNSTGDMKADEAVVEQAFEVCAKHQIVLVAHCECSSINNEAAAAVSPTTVAAHSERRPAQSEVESVRWAVGLAQKYGTPLHIAHLSTAGGLDLVKAAKAAGLRVTCEVTPHHLFLTTQDYPELQSLIKVNPPIRAHEKEFLWQGLVDGVIDCVATDHAPHLLDEKALGANAPSGMPGVEVVLPLMLSVVAGRWPHPTAPPPAAVFGEGGKAISFDDLERLMFTNPNRIFSLGCSDAKGIKASTEGNRTLKNEDMHSKCGWTPYHGWVLQGSWEYATSA